MNVLITLTTAGADTGPFNLYSNVDSYTTAFETGISRAALIAGYTSSLAPDGLQGLLELDLLCSGVSACKVLHPLALFSNGLWFRRLGRILFSKCVSFILTT